jgi:CheY-like chemotaxis protein
VPSVLIVDDDPFIRKLIWTTLEDVADVDLVQAADGGQALDAARAERPSIVFLDIDMPVLDGAEVCRRLRADGSDATIVMLTAAARDEAERECEEAGADLFLTKPFSPLELLRLVDDLGKTAPSR